MEMAMAMTGFRRDAATALTMSAVAHRRRTLAFEIAKPGEAR